MKAAIMEQVQHQAKIVEARAAKERRASIDQNEIIIKTQTALKLDEERVARERTASAEQRENILKAQIVLKAEEERISREKALSMQQHENFIKAQTALKTEEERLARDKALSMQQHENVIKTQTILKIEEERLAKDRVLSTEERQKSNVIQEHLRLEKEQFAIEKERFKIEKEQFARDKENAKIEYGVFENSKGFFIKALQEKEKLLDEQNKLKIQEIIEIRTKLIQHQEMLQKAQVRIVEKSTILRLEEEAFEKKNTQNKDKEEGKKPAEFDNVGTLALLDQVLTTSVVETINSPTSSTETNMHDILLEPLSILEPVPYLDQGFLVVNLAGDTVGE